MRTGFLSLLRLYLAVFDFASFKFWTDLFLERIGFWTDGVLLVYDPDDYGLLVFDTYGTYF